jgi:hypothetical protein
MTFGGYAIPGVGDIPIYNTGMQPEKCAFTLNFPGFS